MTDTDTRAALDAAILKYGGDAATSYEFHARPPDDRDLNAAITAHVEAEVTRRLAAADSVDEAIEDFDEKSQTYGLARRNAGPDGLAEVEAEQVASIERLRAAIAADRERAVAEATDGAVQGERFAAAICRLVGARETGTGGQTVDACTASLYADAAKRIERMLARDKARPTPDEARRLVDEYGNACCAALPAIEAGARGDGDAIDAMTAVIDRGNKARTALLRALGVEA